MSSVFGFLWPVLDVLTLNAIGVVLVAALSLWFGLSRRSTAGVGVALGVALMTTGFAAATMLAIAGFCLMAGVALGGLLSLVRRWL